MRLQQHALPAVRTDAVGACKSVTWPWRPVPHTSPYRLPPTQPEIPRCPTVPRSLPARSFAVLFDQVQNLGPEAWEIFSAEEETSPGSITAAYAPPLVSFEAKQFALVAPLLL